MPDSSMEVNKNSEGYTYSIKAYGQSCEEIRDKLEILKREAEEIIGEAEKSAS